MPETIIPESMGLAPLYPASFSLANAAPCCSQIDSPFIPTLARQQFIFAVPPCLSGGDEFAYNLVRKNIRSASANING